MNSFQTPFQPSPPKIPKPKKKTSREMDELCDTIIDGMLICNDMRRNHIEGVCGVYPCPCTAFTSSGRFFQWSPDAKS